MRVNGVSNFYLRLEHLSEEGAEFTSGYFILVTVSVLLATGGLLVNSIPVIIGSMCIAPFIGPSRAICIGVIYRKWNTVWRGLAKQLIGILVIGPPFAFLITLAFLRVAPEITATPTIIQRTIPTLISVYLAIFVALASGAAASLALTASHKIVSESRQQLLEVIIGTEIAISLIPAAAVVGIELAFGRAYMAVQALSLLFINLVCLDFITSIPVLYFRGVRLEHLRIEKKIRDVAKKTINDIVEDVEIITEVVFQSDKKTNVIVQVRIAGIHSDVVPLFAKNISESIKKETGFSNSVKVTIVPTSTYSS